MPAAPPRTPRPGWYADPRGGDDFRWWDGAGWTAWLSESEYAPRPRGEVARLEPSPVLAPPRKPAPFLIGLGVLVVILVLSILSLIGQAQPQAGRPMRDLAPTAAGTPPRIHRPYHIQDRVVIIYEKVAMPVPTRDVPQQTDKPLPTVLTTAWIGGQVFAPGKQTFGILGDAEPAVIVDDDARATAEKVLPALLSRYDSGVATTPGEIRLEPWPRLPGAYRLDTALNYVAPDEGATADEVTIIVVPYRQGERAGMAVWAAILPNNATPEVRSAYTGSADSIHLLD